MCLRDQDMYDDNGGVGIVRRARGLRDDDRGVRRGLVIYYASKGLGTKFGGGGGYTKGPRNLQQQRMRRRRKMSTKTTTMTMEASA